MAVGLVGRGTRVTAFWDDSAVPVDTRDPNRTNPWDHVRIAGIYTPGIAVVSGRNGVSLDKKRSPGTDGATITELGYQPGEVDIAIRMWTADQWAAWADMRQHLIPRPSKGKPEPVQVYHPALADAGIKALYIQEIGLPRDVPPRGMKEILIRASEWLPAKKAAAPGGTGAKWTPQKSTDYTKLPTAIHLGGQPPSKTKAGP